MERWSAIDAEDVHLATIRVYHNAKSSSGKKPRIMLFLPPAPDSPNEPEEFELDTVNEAVENQVVIAEREKEPGTASRARTTILTGRVKHECNLRPVLSDRYRQRLKERHLRANQPGRTIKRIEEEHPGDRGAINRLTSGVSNTTGFSDLVVRLCRRPRCCFRAQSSPLQKPKQKPPKGQFERMARMPRNQLLDLLFSLFREQEHWSIKPMRERTQQPEAYLKETLSEIAFMHRSGEHNGTWELMANFKGEGVSACEPCISPKSSLTHSLDQKRERSRPSSRSGRVVGCQNGDGRRR